MDEYKIDDIKDTMDETGEVPERIYFFYGGDSQQFVDALEFIGLSPTKFAAFLLSDLGRQTTTQNKLSIHIESGDIFYHNHNTEENFYDFLLSQKNDEAAHVPKNFPTTIALKSISLLFCRHFLSRIKKNLIFLYLRIQSIYFTDLMILLKRMETLDTNYFTLEKC